jgi:hypothetical protein
MLASNVTKARAAWLQGATESFGFMAPLQSVEASAEPCEKRHG